MSGLSTIVQRSLSSIVTLIVGLFVLVSIPGQIAFVDDGGLSPFNARTLPYIITIGIIILSLGIIVSNAISIGEEQGNFSAIGQAEAVSYLRVFLTFFSIALWIVLLPYVGFNIATLLLVTSVMLLIGSCRWWQIAVLAFVLSVPLNYLFEIVLRVYLPKGSLFD